MRFVAARALLALAVVAPAALAVACSSDDDTAATGGTTTTPTATATADSGTAATSKDIVDTAVAAGSFSTLVSAVQAAGLESTLRGAGPFTVLAPTNDAFAKLPSFLTTKLLTAPYKAELGLILGYHVISGDIKSTALAGKTTMTASVAGPELSIDGTSGSVIVNGTAKVTSADVGASNGTIHVLDSVLLPSLVDTAKTYDDGTTKFSTLVTAITAADLGATLSGPGPFTVFAPTDAAFASLKTALGDTAFNALLADKAKLTKVLTYHVVSGAVYSPDVKAGPVPTVETSSFTVAITDGKVTIADTTATKANVVLTDLPASNGVIHVIDKVLVPAGIL